MRVLVTGGGGFFGKALRLSPPKSDIVWMKRGEYPGGKFDFVLDMIPDPLVTPEIVAIAKASHAKVLFTSSGAVYGRDACGVTEYAGLGPETDYAVGKIWSESLWRKSGLEVAIARCFAFVGPGLQPHFAISQFIRDATDGGPITVKELSVRSYMHSRDLAEWLWKLLFEAEGIWNVGSDLPVTTPMLAALVRDIICPQAKVKAESLPKGTVYYPSTEKAHGFGFWQRVGLEEALEEARDTKAVLQNPGA